MLNHLVDTYKTLLDQVGDPTAAAILAVGATQSAQPLATSDWLTIKEASAEFKISERSLYRLSGLHHRNGKSVRLKRSDLKAHLEGEGTRLH